jgi:competence protein ComEA
MNRGALIARKLLPIAFAVLAACTGGTMLAGTNAGTAASKPKQPVATKPLLDLNKATIYDLEQLPGIGGAEARKIIDGRPYRTKADLLSRKIIPQATYTQIAPLVNTTIHKVSAKPNC